MVMVGWHGSKIASSVCSGTARVPLASTIDKYPLWDGHERRVLPEKRPTPTAGLNRRSVFQTFATSFIMARMSWFASYRHSVASQVGSGANIRALDGVFAAQVARAALIKSEQRW